VLRQPDQDEDEWCGKKANGSANFTTRQRTTHCAKHQAKEEQAGSRHPFHRIVRAIISVTAIKGQINVV
jgi:hypothetical protein